MDWRKHFTENKLFHLIHPASIERNGDQIIYMRRGTSEVEVYASVQQAEDAFYNLRKELVGTECICG
jgi:hypothetical protein